ncbi:MAG TPA: hypothetical protein VIS96_12245 [Terrimicrobiaceae bacterium]
MEDTIRRVIEAAMARNLPFLLIGGHAVILLGFARNTIDIDLLVPIMRRSAWLDLMRELGFRFYHGTGAFAQFEPEDKSVTSVDLMFVDDHTWNVLSEAPITKALAGHEVRLPRPEHLVALKLHAAKGPDRSKPESDWEDIRQIMQICGLDIVATEFRAIVLRHGGEEAVRRIESFRK